MNDFQSLCVNMAWYSYILNIHYITKLKLMKMTASGEKTEGIMASKEPLKWFMVYSSIMFIPGHRQLSKQPLRSSLGFY